jgi:hypothetical protein
MELLLWCFEMFVFELESFISLWLIIILKVFVLKAVASYVIYKILRRVHKISRREMSYVTATKGMSLIEASVLGIISFSVIFLLISTSNLNLAPSKFMQVITFFTAATSSSLLLAATVKLSHIRHIEVIPSKKGYFNFSLSKLLIASLEN